MVRVKPIPFCSQYRASSSSVEEIPQHQEHMGSPMYLSVTSPPGACFAPWGRVGAASGIRQLPVAGSQFMSVMVGVHRLRLYGGLPRLSRRQRSAGQPIGRHGAQNSSA